MCSLLLKDLSFNFYFRCRSFTECFYILNKEFSYLTKSFSKIHKGTGKTVGLSLYICIFDNRAIGIINFEKHFLNSIVDTMN